MVEEKLFNQGEISVHGLFNYKDSTISTISPVIFLVGDSYLTINGKGDFRENFVDVLLDLEKANIELVWDRACAIDLATRGTSKSVLEAVRTSINPKVIDCMIEGRETIDGVAKDGIQVKVRVRVTVRSNLDRYVGSAQEETVIARVGESIVSTIGSSELSLIHI